jgi:hypothetical protein
MACMSSSHALKVNKKDLNEKDIGNINKRSYLLESLASSLASACQNHRRPPIVERRISETADGVAGDKDKAGRVAGDAAEMVRVAGDAPKGWTRCPAAASLRIELVGKHSVTRGSHS